MYLGVVAGVDERSTDRSATEGPVGMNLNPGEATSKGSRMG